jgi:outer membrane biosynthesis protein TonB
MVMPVGRYIAWVGASLLALLLAVDWFLPKSLPEPAGESIEKPVIRIASVQPPPERVVIDTSQPITVPALPPDEPETTSEPSPVPSYASAPQPPPPLPAVVGIDKKKSKVTQRKGTGVATNQPLPTRAPAAVSASPAPAAPTRLSFADIISGQLVRNLFNLH